MAKHKALMKAHAGLLRVLSESSLSTEVGAQALTAAFRTTWWPQMEASATDEKAKSRTSCLMLVKEDKIEDVFPDLPSAPLEAFEEAKRRLEAFFKKTTFEISNIRESFGPGRLSCVFFNLSWP